MMEAGCHTTLERMTFIGLAVNDISWYRQRPRYFINNIDIVNYILIFREEQLKQEEEREEIRRLEIERLKQAKYLNLKVNLNLAPSPPPNTLKLS